MSPPAVAIIVSPHPLLVRREVEAIESQVGEDPIGFNRSQFVAKQTTAQEIIAAVSTLPMMAPYRLVKVRGIEQMASKELALLLPYIEDPCPTSVLVMTASSIDKRVKFFQQAKKLGFITEAGAPRDLASFCLSEAKEKGIMLSSSAARRLAEVVGDDVSRLSSCVDQLGLYALGREVTAEDVDELIAPTREQSIFEITEAVGSGDRRKAYEAAEKLLEQRQSAIAVIALLGRYVRQLAVVRSGLQARRAQGDIAKAAGIPPFVVQKLKPAAGRYDRSATSRALRVLADVDFALKGGNNAGKTLGRDLSEQAHLHFVVDTLIDLQQR